jgi:hypothetical protein
LVPAFSQDNPERQGSVGFQKMQEYSRGTAITDPTITDPKKFGIPTNERDRPFSFWVERRCSPAITTREGIGFSR